VMFSRLMAMTVITSPPETWTDCLPCLSRTRVLHVYTFEIATTDTLPGHRPVAVSHLEISESGMLPGNRPIASNDIDEAPGELMGYLD
ncbi:MAG: hypothetical protein AAFZ80_11165, partial [Cyanobacteria bacterium P01_A01_bin.105]